MGLSLPPQIGALLGKVFGQISGKVEGASGLSFDDFSTVSRTFQESLDVGFGRIIESRGKSKTSQKVKSAPVAKVAKKTKKKPTLLALGDESGIARPSLLGQ